MSQFDSDHRGARGTPVGAEAAGTEGFVGRNSLPIKVAAFYALVLATAILARRVVSGPNVEILLSIAIWFTVIFAACSALLGGVVKLVGAVQQRRHDYE
ncbi:MULTISPECIES: hypothetical protein [Halobacterium]|uniref:hypothetical protein n=1 Tax=Halobacterium TaxID=2239 RepID=UPI00073E8F71|nr:MULTISPECIES: hypothetical protein [Halobacterium]MCG1002680.1 hypothetical protein [Halobacterium noricense]